MAQMDTGDSANQATNLGLLHDNHKHLAERVTLSEKDIADLTPTMTVMSERLTNLEAKVQTLEIWPESGQNRVCQNNISVMGLPERFEGDDMLTFLEKWLPEKVAPEGLTPFFVLERAHKVPARSSSPTAPP
ncbi:hypothetical protein NDU88_005617 [Pleurodeles waltl]|uniref:Uncharacterized protein n=1 Tax=Pleurodeles waltl TaxID=8319 RepID=A0AAV7SM81_PLEWA|nr:hypothetical protein NDU88_005617 [Pleurodeles waltl]